MNPKLELDLITKMSMPVTMLTLPPKYPSKIIKSSTSRAASFTQGLTTTPDRILLGKKTSQDKEIDIFDARKYFNEGLNHTTKICTKSLPNHHHQQQLKKDVVQTAVKEHLPPTAVLSIRSKWSWNSRSSLLRTVPRSQQQLSKTSKKGFLASIGCNCSCLTTSIISGRSKPGNKTNDHLIKTEKQERERRSQQQQVFGTPIHIKGKNCFNMDTNLTMVTWDAITPLSAPEELKIPSISSEMHNDSDSDASSDLFEIESFYIDNPFDPTTCYAPSEASTEWSVVTASAADFSLLSDSDDVSSTIQTQCIKKSCFNTKTASFREMPKIRPSILSGCKSQKAVGVAGDAQTTRRPLTPMTRFHDDNKLRFNANSRQSSLNHHVISQSRSATAAHL